MDKLIERLCALQQRDTVWQGDVVSGSRLLLSADIPGSLLVGLWVDVDEGYVQSGRPLEPGDDMPLAMLENLAHFAERELRYRPRRIEVSDTALYEFLTPRLEGSGIEVALVPQVNVFEFARDDLQSSREAERKPTPGPLDGQGVEEEHLLRLAEASGAFLKAAPWEWLTDVDVVEFKALNQPASMHCCVVMGRAGLEFGLSVYNSLPSYRHQEKCVRSGDRYGALKNGVLGFTLEDFDGLPKRDQEFWANWPRLTNGDRPYPFVIRFRSKEPGGPPVVERPSRDELAFLEALLRAFAAVTEEKIDGARWQQAVDTIDGPLTISFSLPDLVNPPSHAEWVRRGYRPDPRGTDRVMSDLVSFIEKLQPSSQAEMNQAVEVFRRSYSPDKRTDTTSTGPKRAQDLCYSAFDSHGRRRLQLAREALQVCPDCVDAHVLLAEWASPLAEKLAHYERGVAAGERSLGPEKMQEYAGKFWEAIETRPYMRARFSAAMTLAELGRLDEAIAHCQALLQLNARDAQGVRHFLAPLLLESGRDAEAAALFREFDEVSTVWRYSKALIAFRINGRGAIADRELKAALRCNEHFPEMLVGDRRFDRHLYYEPGDEVDAAHCADELRTAFADTPGAIDWVVTVDQIRRRELNQRRLEQRRKQRQVKRDRKRRRK